MRRHERLGAVLGMVGLLAWVPGCVMGSRTWSQEESERIEDIIASGREPLDEMAAQGIPAPNVPSNAPALTYSSTSEFDSWAGKKFKLGKAGGKSGKGGKGSKSSKRAGGARLSRR